VKVVFNAELWLWDARRTETWTFVSLPASQSEEIRDLAISIAVCDPASLKLAFSPGRGRK